MKKSLGLEAKKDYVKPEIVRNEPLVDITFASATASTAVSSATAVSVATVAGSLSGTAGAPGGFITSHTAMVAPVSAAAMI